MEISPTASRRRVALVCYAIEQGKGSEEGSGYNFARQIAAMDYDLTLLTRPNNAALLNDDPAFANVEIVGYDPPRWKTFWKRKGFGVIPFYYLWQRGVAKLVESLHRELPFDTIHQYNFHADWAPHFFQADQAKIVWGPIVHHPPIPAAYYFESDRAAKTKDAMRTRVKRFFWFRDPAMKRAISRSDVIIYGNEDIAPPFANAGDKVQVVPYGAAEVPRQDLPVPQGSFSVISVGRFVPLKGFRPALEAFAMFSRTTDGRDAQITFVGKGPQKEELQALGRELGIEEKMRFIPWLAQEELPALFATAHAMLYPSVESQGMVVTEATAVGTPVIAIEGTGPGLLGGEGSLKVTAQPKGKLVERLADALMLLAKEVAHDPQAYRSRREAVQSSFMQRLTPAEVARRISEHY